MAGFGHAVPQRRVRNGEIEQRHGLEPGWIERRTGIRSRYWAGDGETLSDLAAQAGQMALDMALDRAAIPRDAVALTLLATSTPDHLLPPTAPLLAHKLALSRSGAIDLAGACAGFLYALTLADAFVRAQGCPVLVVAANILSRRINPAERASAILFADAAGAVVLAPDDNPQRGLLAADLASDGSGYGLISIPAGGSSRPFSGGEEPEAALMTMRDGRSVFARAVDMMAATSKRALQQADMAAARIDRFIPHQANARLFDAVARDLGIDPARTVRTIETYGNSSAATIALSLSVASQQKPFAEGEALLLAAAGAGLTGGAAVFVI